MSTVPFAQLFIIHRLLNKNGETATNVTALFTDGDIQHQKAVTKMAQNLKKLGLKRFMEDEYDENQLNTLSLLFNKMIHAYPNDYKKILSFEINCLPIDEIENTNSKQTDNPNTNNTNNTCTNNNNVNPNTIRYHESKLFNQSDLIPQAFQYLYFNDINQCCLVNSIWLYHGYNINSIYSPSTYKWLQWEKENKFVNARQRVWQRWINARQFTYYNWREGILISNDFLDGFKKLQNVKYINITLAKYNNEREKEFVESICKRGKNYKRFSLHVYYNNKIDASKLGKLPNINLYNAKEIDLSQLLIPISFTNKCEKLILSQMNNITLDWCKYLIKNCDLTNIKRLKLEDIKFDFGMEKNSTNNNDNNNSKQNMITEIANKFTNLKYFTVEAINDDILTFWKALVPIIKKNNVELELDTHDFDRHANDAVSKKELFNKVLKFIENELESQLKTIILGLDIPSKKRSLKFLNLKTIQSNIEKLGIIPFSERSFRWTFSLTRVKTSELEIDQTFLINDSSDDDDDDSIDDDNKDNNDNNEHNSKNYFDLTEKFNKLKILQIPYSIGTFNLVTVVDFLQIKFSTNNYFIDIDFDVRFKAIDQSDEDSSSSSFERNLQTLFNICMEMIENQIPIIVKIKFKQFHGQGYTKEMAIANQQSYQKYNDQLFKPLFANNKNIKVAKCNPFCKPLSAPKFEFVLNDSCVNVGDTVRHWIDVGHLTIQTASVV